MKVTGECLFISCREGEKKDGSAWYSTKFLDEQAEEFFTVFHEKNIYKDMCKLEKKTPVLLTLNLVPGQKYFTLENIEVLVQI